MNSMRLILLSNVVVMWLCCFASGQENQAAEKAINSSTTASDREDGDSDPIRLDFQAWINIHVLPEKALRKDVSALAIIESIKSLDRNNIHRDEDIKNWAIPTHTGKSVALHEVARINILLLCEGSPLAKQVSRVRSGGRKARVEIRPKKGKLVEYGVSIKDIKAAVDCISPKKEYALEDIQTLIVPRQKRTGLSLVELADVGLVIQSSGDNPDVPQTGFVEALGKGRFLAKVAIRTSPARANGKGVLVSDIEHTLGQGLFKKNYDLHDLERLPVIPSVGPPIYLQEIADVEITLILNKKSVSSPRDASHEQDEIPKETDSYLEAWIDLIISPKNLLVKGVKSEAISRALENIAPNGEYRLKDFQDLKISAEDGSMVRLSEVALISISLKGPLHVDDFSILPNGERVLSIHGVKANPTQEKTTAGN